MTVSFEEHLNEATALIDAALRIVRDPTISRADKADEVLRIVDRVRSHAVAMEFLAELMVLDVEDVKS